MPYKLCCLCADTLSRAGSESINCTVCENIFHKDCILNPNLESCIDLSTWKCYECVGNADLKSLKEKVDGLRSDIVKLQKHNTSTLKSVEDQLSIVSDLTVKIERNSNSIEYLKKSYNVLQRSVSSLSNHEKQRQVVITGVPERPKEDLFKIVCNIGRLLKIDHLESMIDNCFRFRPKASTIKPILLIFISCRTRDKFLQSFRSRKKLIIGNEIGFPSEVKVAVGEHILGHQQSLLQLCKDDLLKPGIVKYVWFQNNNILVRKVEGDKAMKISSIDDVKQLKKPAL